MLFFSVVLLLIFSNSMKVQAYGETIEGFQTHYEVQNQYQSGNDIIIEGFYFVLYLQNYIDSTKDTGTHYYKMQLSNGSKSFTYYDTGNYYVDLTQIELKTGASWITPGESDIATPNQPNYNYRYRDVGFQFKIPVSDIADFTGDTTSWNINISCVARNTYKGKQVNWEFKQTNIYASKTFAEFEIGDNRVSAKTSLENYSSVISADVAYVRTTPGKDASNSNRAMYYGAYLFWGTGQRFYDLSINATVNSGVDKLTWYRLSYGNIYYDGRYRAAYQANSGNYGWIPSVFFGSVSGTPYYIKVINIPPKITALDKSFNEGTAITSELLLENVSASDYSFGTKKPDIKATDLMLNSSRNRVGKYYLTYKVTDTRNVSVEKTVSVNILNTPPSISVVGELKFDYGELINKEKLFKGLVDAFDVYDGSLKDKVYIKDYGGIVIDRSDNLYKKYLVVFAVKDSNGAESTATLNLTISYQFTRSINSDYLYTISGKSKWKTPKLYNGLEAILNKDSSNDSECQEIWVFTNEGK